MKKFLIFLICALSLTSCKKPAPQVPLHTFPAVSVTTSETYPATEAEPIPLPEIAQDERGGLSEIRENLEDDLAEKYPNIEIISARIPDCEEMPITPIRIGIDPGYDLKPLADRLFGGEYDTDDPALYTEKFPDDPIDKSRPAGSNNRVGIYIKVFTPDENDQNMLAIMHSTGHLRGSQTGYLKNKTAYSPYAFDECVLYDLEDPLPDDLEYTMGDGESWRAGEAVKYIEEFFADYVTPSDPDRFSYHVKRLAAIDIGESKYGYFFEMEARDGKGRAIDRGSGAADIGNYRKMSAGKPFMTGFEVYAWCAGKESISTFSRSISFEECDPEKPGEELITLKKAAEIISEALPDDFAGRYQAELNYVIFCKGYPAAGDDPSYSSAVLRTQCDFELRPMWVFRKEAASPIDQNNFDGEFFVDATTGEMCMRLLNQEFGAGEIEEGAEIYKSIKKDIS